jgi:hypothetical protein
LKILAIHHIQLAMPPGEEGRDPSPAFPATSEAQQLIAHAARRLDLKGDVAGAEVPGTWE